MNRNEHLLAIVAEEAVEVAQRATKALRFGVDEVQPGQEYTNWQRIEHEFHDLIAALEMAHGRPLNISRSRIDAKKAKVEKYLAYSTELGTLHDADGVDLPVGPRNGLARIEGDAIVIRLTADACAFAFANDPHAQEPRPPVIDKQGFLRDTFHALTNEREDGSTPLTDVLDRAMVKAMEDGSDALDHDAPGVNMDGGKSHAD